MSNDNSRKLSVTKDTDKGKKLNYQPYIGMAIVKRWSAGGGYVSLPDSLVGKKVLIVSQDNVEGIEVTVKKLDQAVNKE